MSRLTDLISTTDMEKDGLRRAHIAIKLAEDVSGRWSESDKMTIAVVKFHLRHALKVLEDCGP